MIRTTTLRSTLPALFLMGAVATMAPASANAGQPSVITQVNPSAEQLDGCDHGNSGKPCRQDPQGERGKDCELHGNRGGINEDHCGSWGGSSS